MKKKILSLVVLLALVFSLVACGDDPKKEINLETKVESQEETIEEKTDEVIASDNPVDIVVDNISKNDLELSDNSDSQDSITIVQKEKTISSHFVSKEELNKTAEYIYSKVQNPQVGSIGGEWAVIGLKQSEYAVDDDYFNRYYSNVYEYTKSNQGVLHTKKYTEYSRVSLALSLIGQNPTYVEGYNLIEPLNDFDKTIWQGNNGSIWALITFDSSNFKCETRDAYVNEILRVQTDNGSWSISGLGEDIDITAMALTALSNYTSRKDVRSAIEKGFIYLEDKFLKNEITFSESYAQCLVAYSANHREMPSGMYETFISYRLSDGSFIHTQGGESNLMASEQGLYALAGLYRAENGMGKLFVKD